MAKFEKSGSYQVLDTFQANNGGRQITSGRDNIIEFYTLNGDLHIHGAYGKAVPFNLQHVKCELQRISSTHKLATSKVLEISSDDGNTYDTLSHLDFTESSVDMTKSEPQMGVDIEEWSQKLSIYNRDSETDYRGFSNAEISEQVQEYISQQDLWIPDENSLPIEEQNLYIPPQPDAPQYGIEIISKLDSSRSRYPVIFRELYEDNWISDRVLEKAGILPAPTTSPVFLCFPGKVLKAKGIVDLTCFRENSFKSLRERFHVVSTNRFYVLFGGKFLSSSGYSILTRSFKACYT